MFGARMKITAALSALMACASAAADAVDFARDVRPILEKSCFGCHGQEKQKNGYRLDVRDIAIKGGDSGERAIVPHDAKSSPLIRYVSGEDEDMLMPPKKSDKPRLTAEQIATLRAWIDAGPAWPDELAGPKDAKPQWSLQPLAKPAVPSAEENPIDAFISAKLAEKKIAPSPEADRRTLIRRVYYDLTGLPPTPAEVDAFAADTATEAYEKLVARLLASPRYGERWARHWLDTIHFADSHGFEHDIGRDNAWRFRDYVIAALNKDTPWPRFIREQLAADVFFPDEPQLTPALGYLGAGTFDLSAFSTAPVTFDYLDRDDLVTQTMAAFVSTTANCARCHAHKFDPITQEDYYALQAVFAGVLKGDVSYDEDIAVKRQRQRWQSIIAAADKRDPAILLAAENAPLTDEWLAQRGGGARWQPLDAETFLSAEGATLTRGADGIILASGALPERDTYTITAASVPERTTALRLNVLPHDSLPMHGPGRTTNGNLHLSEIEVRFFEPGAPEGRVVKLSGATADFNQADWGIHRALDGDIKTAWGIHPAVGQAHHAVFAFAEPLILKPGARLAITLRQAHGGSHLIGAFSLAVTTDAAANAAALSDEVEAALAATVAERTEAQRVVLAAHALRVVANEALAKLPPQAVVYAAASAVNIPAGEGAMQVRTLPEPKVVNVLHRGDFDKPRAVAEPGALSALTPLPARFVLKNPKDEAERRAALADWIAHPENPLTWRSVVNRVWHYHFGRGLCDTPSDFGKMGGELSHVELLNWLAVWFRDDAHGSLKELHRLIVTSATYRQSSLNTQHSTLNFPDADNRLLWRQNRHRLDADAVRDFTLAASGAVDLTMGGPSIRHFKSSKGPQATPALDYTAYNWSSAGAGRRSIYRNVWRGIADPFMESLDFPDLGLLAPVRSFSVSSLQALTLFNNDFILHHSAALATRAQTETTTPEAQIANAVRLVWLRELTADEVRDFTEFARLNGLPDLCRVLLNSNEFLFIP